MRSSLSGLLYRHPPETLILHILLNTELNVKSILLAKGPVDDAPCGRFPPGPLERLSVRWWYRSLGPAYKTARVRPGTSTPRPWDGSHARTVVGSSSPPISRYFYKPKPLRTLAEIQTDIRALEQETEGLLDDIIGTDDSAT